MKTQLPTIKQLKTAGHHVQVIFSRLVAPDPKKLRVASKAALTKMKKGEYKNLPTITVPLVTLPRGGSTEVIIDTKNGNHYEGVSHCHAEKDVFQRRAGLTKAIAKVVQAAAKNNETLV